MSIASKLEYLDGTKDYIRQCIQQKGVTVPEDTTFRQYGDKILEIESASENPPATDAVLEEGIAIPTGQDFDLLPSEGYDGFSKVTVKGDYNLRPENIAVGVTIYGVTGTMQSASVVGSNIPSVYQGYFDEARKLYTGDYKNLIILESNDDIAFGFLLDGFNVESYDDNSTEFTASKWVYVAYHKPTSTWKVEDWTTGISNGGSFIRNIRYSDTYIYYGERLIYPFVEEEKIPFRVIYRIDTGNTYRNYGGFEFKGIVTVDWGDGSEPEEYNDGGGIGDARHVYSSSGDYTVTITGNIKDIWFYRHNSLYKVLDPFPKSMSSITESTGILFQNCDLVEVPANLFQNCPNFDGYSLAFENTDMETIPVGLFDYCPEGVNLGGCFYTSKKLKGIPSGLFDKLKNPSSFSRCFAYSQLLTGNVPPLWEMFPNAKGSNCFEGCGSITNYDDIPEDWK